MTILLIMSTDPHSPGKFYGAPCIPTVKGRLWECDTKDEYLAMRGAFEESEGNCNNCKFLERVKTADKDPAGFMTGICAKVVVRPLTRFHPEDPAQNICWESRRAFKPWLKNDSKLNTR